MNSFEASARAAKVAAILTTIPTTGTARRIRLTADWAAGLSQVDRDRLAASAGQHSPSVDTWAAVVDGLRARRTVGQSIVPALFQVSL